MKETRYVRGIVLPKFHAHLKHLSVLTIVKIKNPEAAAIIKAANKFKFQHCFRTSPAEKKAMLSEKCNMGKIGRARTGRWRCMPGARAFTFPPADSHVTAAPRSAVIYIPNLYNYVKQVCKSPL